MTKISIVVPVYFNEHNLPPLYEDLKKNVLSVLDCDYEIIFVDDGSKDQSYNVARELKKKDKNIRAIKLSRNFGSHAAILAGFTYSTGDCAVIKAADLQEPSTLINEMYKKWKSGDKVVLALREERNESFSQKLFANLYYSLMRKFAFKDMPKGGFDCCLIDKKVIRLLKMMDEKNTTLMGQILWCGFKRSEVYYVRQARKIGKSKWTLKKKFDLVLDSLFGFSYAPIKFLTLIGILFALFALVWGIVIIINRFIGDISVSGWTALMLLVLFSSGLIMLGLGIIGEYIWRTFDAAKKRPPFIVDQFDEESPGE